MISYTTPATIKANNAAAEAALGVKLVGHDHKGSRSEDLARGHAEALARRKAG